jgi:starvation-inducible DNA-binding protein
VEPHSDISDITRNQRLNDSDQEPLTPKDMLTPLCADNKELNRFLHLTHQVCEGHNDVATTSLIENWIDDSERRIWFISEILADL